MPFYRSGEPNLQSESLKDVDCRSCEYLGYRGALEARQNKPGNYCLLGNESISSNHQCDDFSREPGADDYLE